MSAKFQQAGSWSHSLPQTGDSVVRVSRSRVGTDLVGVRMDRSHNSKNAARVARMGWGLRAVSYLQRRQRRKPKRVRNLQGAVQLDSARIASQWASEA